MGCCYERNVRTKKIYAIKAYASFIRGEQETRIYPFAIHGKREAMRLALQWRRKAEKQIGE